MVPANFNFLLADRERWMTIREWERLGVKRAGGKAFARADDRAFLLVPAGVQGPGFLMLANFRVLMKYNPAEAYALAIGHLADRLRGGEAFVQQWPRYERTLSLDERLELQQLAGPPRLRCRDADGHLGAAHAGGDPRLPGAQRPGSGRLCLGGRCWTNCAPGRR